MAWLGVKWTGTASGSTTWTSGVLAAVAWLLSFVRDSAPPERTIGATALIRRVPANPERGRPMQLTWPAKEPAEVLDYGIDWRERQLGEDPLVSAQYEVMSGDVSIDRDSVDPSGYSTTAWLSGGTINTRSVVKVTARTQSGRVMIERVAINVRER